MHRPMVTVLMPVLNGEEWIAEALESIRHQTFQDLEVLIIDDGCTDNSIAIIRSMNFPAIRIIQGPRQGLGAALAVGVNASESEFLARQDSDDLSEPTRLEKQVAVMMRNPNCVIVGSWANAIDENGRHLRIMKTPWQDKSIKTALNFFNPFVHTSVVLRREAVVCAGNYRAGPLKAHAEDYDLWTRLTPLGVACNLKETLVSYRIHPTSVTSQWSCLQVLPGHSIAVRTTEATLGRSLSLDERQLLGSFYNRRRGLKLLEALRLYQLMLDVVTAQEFPPPLRAFSWRQWLSPLVWVLRKLPTNNDRHIPGSSD